MYWRLDNWVKHFGQTIALRGVSFKLEANTIYGLVGPNGSGKSTLVKAITGIVRLDQGRFFHNDALVTIRSPLDAYKHNICAAHQELSLVPGLSVIDNFRIAALLKSRLFNLPFNNILQRMLELLNVFNPGISICDPISRLGRTKQQIVEIVKALGYQPELLLLDEPTSFLTERDIECLFEILKMYKTSATILFISHRLKEILKICDKIIVLRDGVNVGEFTATEVDVNDLVEIMAGRGVSPLEQTLRATHPPKTGEVPFFSARVKSAKVKDVQITAARGEIVGLAGLVGHGQSDLLRALCGLVPSNKTITLEGKNVRIGSPADAIRNGIVYISGVQEDMVLPERSVRENIMVIKNGLRTAISLVNNRFEHKCATEMVKKLNIVCRSIEEPVRLLSGGNQQKTVVARALALKPKVLLLDDPLKGIDTLTKSELYSLLRNTAEDCAIIFFASDVDELLPIATRIIVMYEGSVVAELAGEKITKENILAAALRGGTL